MSDNVCIDDGGLINPENFICKSADLNTASITSSADSVAAIGSSVLASAQDANTAWTGVQSPGVFETPDAEAVYALMNPAVDSATQLDGVTSRVSSALSTYATELDGIKPTLAEFEERAAAFRTRALEGYEVSAWEADGFFSTVVSPGDWGKTKTIPWIEHTPATDMNEALLQEYNEILARISTAAATCANAIKAELTTVCAAPSVAITAEELNAYPELSTWGQAVTEERNCTESVGHGLGNVWEGLWTGGAALIGRDPVTGEWSLGNAGQAWLGVGDFVLSTVIVASPLGPALLTAPGPIGDFTRDRYNTAYTAWGSLIGWDHQAYLAGENGWHKWEEDGIAAFTESAGNIGTFFIPVAGWAGGAAKTATTAARVSGFVVRNAARGAEFIVPGGSHLVVNSARVVSFGVHGMPGGWRALVDVVTPTTVRPSVGPGVVTPATSQLPSGTSLPANTPVSESLGLDTAGNSQQPATHAQPTSEIPAESAPNATQMPTPDGTASSSTNVDAGATDAPTDLTGRPEASPGGTEASSGTGADGWARDGGPTADRYGREYLERPDGRRTLEGDPEHTYRDRAGRLHDDGAHNFVADSNRGSSPVFEAATFERIDTPELTGQSGLDYDAAAQSRTDAWNASQDAAAKLNERADSLGIDRAEVRGSDKKVAYNLAARVDAGDLTESQARSLVKLADANRESTNALRQASTGHGTAALDAVQSARDEYAVVTSAGSPGAGRVDGAAVGVDGSGPYITVYEAKGGSSTLGSRNVAGVEAQQGTATYLNDVVRADRRVREGLEAYLENPLGDPAIKDSIRQGTIEIRYELVQARPDGRIDVSRFDLDLDAVEIPRVAMLDRVVA